MSVTAALIIIPKARRNRKISDDQVLRLNNLGMSLTTIADILGCHPTAVTARLKRLNVAASDTRRSFMEQIYSDLTEAEQNWVAEQVGLDSNIKTFITNLIQRAYKEDVA
jgi:predicted transcriptional regulator